MSITRPVRVTIDDRTFQVSFDEAGEVKAIYERKLYAQGTPRAAWHNATYWHNSLKIGSPKTRVARIIEEAKQVKAAKLKPALAISEK